MRLTILHQTGRLLLLLLLSSFVLPAFAQADSCQAVHVDLRLRDRLLINRTSSGDGTSLIRAAKAGELALAVALVEAGADVNKVSKGDGSPLIMAAKHGHLAIVQYLVEQGAKVNQHVTGDETPLIQAAGNGHLEIVIYLIEQGADVNLEVRDGYTLRSERRSALLMARRGRYTDIVNYLIQAGA